jgi:hypothetical protein
MKITAKPLALVVILLFLGGIFFADIMGWWQTTGSKKPVTFVSGEATGEYNPADIRGSYTLAEVNNLFTVPLEDLALAFRIPANDAAAFQLKSLETRYGEAEYEIGTASVRLFVAWYKGLPYDLSEDTYLPIEAATILRDKAALDAVQLSYLDAHAVNPDGSLAGTAAAGQENAPSPTHVESQPAVESTPTPAAAKTEHAVPDRTITGKTTFQNLLDWGMSREKIEQICGFPPPSASNTLIKDAVNTDGGSFPSVKTALQADLDQ